MRGDVPNEILIEKWWNLRSRKILFFQILYSIRFRSMNFEYHHPERFWILHKGVYLALKCWWVCHFTNHLTDLRFPWSGTWIYQYLFSILSFSFISCLLANFHLQRWFSVPATHREHNDANDADIFGFDILYIRVQNLKLL